MKCKLDYCKRRKQHLHDSNIRIGNIMRYRLSRVGTLNAVRLNMEDLVDEIVRLSMPKKRNRRINDWETIMIDNRSIVDHNTIPKYIINKISYDENFRRMVDDELIHLNDETLDKD